MENEQLILIIETIKTSSNGLLTDYTTWFITSSLVWIIAAVLGTVFVSFKFKPEDIELKIVKYGILAIFMFIICLNLVDLIAPQAAAAHQLIRDLRG